MNEKQSCVIVLHFVLLLFLSHSVLSGTRRKREKLKDSSCMSQTDHVRFE